MGSDTQDATWGGLWLSRLTHVTVTVSITLTRRMGGQWREGWLDRCTGGGKDAGSMNG